MKKRIITLIFVSFAALSIVACKDTKKEETNKTAEQTDDKNDIKFKGNDFVITYVKHELGEDYAQNPCLFYYYAFANTSTEAEIPAVVSFITCIQNGEECRQAVVREESEAISNYMAEVQPGESVEVCVPFVLSDSISNVTMEVSSLIPVEPSKDTQEITLE